GRGLSVAALLLACSCGRSLEVVGDVVAKSVRPNHAGQIVISRYNGGATVAYGYHVYVVDRFGVPDEVLVADHVKGLRARWSGNNHIVISMACGRVFSYTNFANSIDRRTGELLEVTAVQ